MNFRSILLVITSMLIRKGMLYVRQGNSDYTVRELPGLNHLFQTCSTGAFSEYVKIEETMSPPALQAVSDWIVARTSVPRENTP